MIPGNPCPDNKARQKSRPVKGGFVCDEPSEGYLAA